MNYPFNYIAPTTLEEAIDILKREENAYPMAGGTDLLVAVRAGKVKPSIIVDIKKIPNLKNITFTEKGFLIGALVTIQELKESNLVKTFYPALWQAACCFGCYEIRLRATIGGNIAHSSPGAETSIPLAIYEAQVIINGPEGEKFVPFNQFITGPGKNILIKGELITGFLIPLYPEDIKSIYLRVSRVEGMDLAVCSLAMLILPPESPQARKIRISVGAVAPLPWRVEPVEKFLEDKPITREVILEAQNIIKESISPRESSIRGTPPYKKEMIAFMLEKAIHTLLLSEERGE